MLFTDLLSKRPSEKTAFVSLTKHNPQNIRPYTSFCKINNSKPDKTLNKSYYNSDSYFIGILTLFCFLQKRYWTWKI